MIQETIAERVQGVGRSRATLPAVLVYITTPRSEQLNGLEALLDKLVNYRDTDASLHFYELLEEHFERVCYEGAIRNVQVLCY